MNKIFAEHIEVLMEVYIDDMLVKMKSEEKLLQDLETMFACLRQHRMRLNPRSVSLLLKPGNF